MLAVLSGTAAGAACPGMVHRRQQHAAVALQQQKECAAVCVWPCRLPGMSCARLRGLDRWNVELRALCEPGQTLLRRYEQELGDCTTTQEKLCMELFLDTL